MWSIHPIYQHLLIRYQKSNIIPLSRDSRLKPPGNPSISLIYNSNHKLSTSKRTLNTSLSIPIELDTHHQLITMNKSSYHLNPNPHIPSEPKELSTSPISQATNWRINLNRANSKKINSSINSTINKDTFFF
jgi:outer membrane usher protein FimD/PapC